MAQLNFKVHPLFFVFGLYFALIGKVFSFLIFVFTAVLHEFGHFLASEKLGYKLNKITLLPFGAIITGDLDGLTYKDECFIALCGPLTNFITAIIFVALWWFLPDLYAYTDLVVIANVSIAVVNLLPAYPLDGGRFLYATLRLYIDRKKAKKIVQSVGVILSVLLFALFVYSIFTSINFTILFFSIFMLVGALSKSQESAYIRLFSDLSPTLKGKVKLVKRIVIHKESKLKSLFTMIDGSYYYEVDVIDDDGIVIARYKGQKLYDLLTTNSIYSKLEDLK